MKHILSLCLVLLCIAASTTRADLLDCNEERFVALPDFTGIGPKTASAPDDDDASAGQEVRDFLKSLGCQIKKAGTKVKEQAKRLGTEIKERAKRLGEKAKDLGAGIKTKFNDFKDRLSKDTDDEAQPHRLLANVEIIDPDVLKAEQLCGHGHILDALGNCRELRK